MTYWLFGEVHEVLSGCQADFLDSQGKSSRLSRRNAKQAKAGNHQESGGWTSLR